MVSVLPSALGIKSKFSAQSTSSVRAVLAEVRVVLAHTVKSVESNNSEGVPEIVPVPASKVRPFGRSGSMSKVGTWAKLRTAA